ncbi:MAG: hypothetical protein HC840_31885 [Leptolyngbyaceae cyanobacterium RM2_2_4]|nr:hypothetical protein [Leptolyngbyaceae cyanobacterium SM1_4_3]NJN89944.1 hypothetical protein [Leptolyngbyaceae cyanobacterium SL_5_14]NJO53245.1 hypothetical protein [Leptolyngbyaceae cyanobacterium RM2_2_4]NJO66536.1 hypothetical protein [Leptolyngbyaceae cyanobacterium RM1_405_57]
MENFRETKRTNDPTLIKLLEADSDLATQAAALANQMEQLQEKRRSLQTVIKMFDSTSASAIETETQSETDLEKRTTAGYSACSPEIDDSKVQGDSFENIVDALKPILSNYLEQQEQQAKPKTDKPIWEIAQEITSDMTEEEIQQLPSDGAEQHDHYIYGTPKRLL